VEDEQRLLLLVMIAGAMGAYLRSTISLATSAERGRLPHPSWVLWCILQTYIGMILAIVFYFVIRGTTNSPQNSIQQLNIFLMVGIAGLVGLFSPQATDKLRTFFESVSVGSHKESSSSEVTTEPKKEEHPPKHS